MTTEKPKIDRTKYMFTDKKNETLIKNYGELDGFNFKIRNLENCKVYILDWTKGMFIDDCTDCEFLIGPCDGSIFIRTSKNCSVSVISKQLRFRDCQNLKICAYSIDPVIESSDNILFAPFNYAFPKAKELFSKANFDINSNKYFNIYDFSEKKNESKMHFRLMEKGEFEVKYLSLPPGLSTEVAGNEFFYDSYPQELEGLIDENASNPIDQQNTKQDNTINDNEHNNSILNQSENDSNKKSIDITNFKETDSNVMVDQSRSQDNLLLETVLSNAENNIETIEPKESNTENLNIDNQFIKLGVKANEENKEEENYENKNKSDNEIVFCESEHAGNQVNNKNSDFNNLAMQEPFGVNEQADLIQTLEKTENKLLSKIDNTDLHIIPNIDDYVLNNNYNNDLVSPAEKIDINRNIDFNPKHGHGINEFNNSKSSKVNKEFVISSEATKSSINHISVETPEEFISPDAKKPFEDFHVLEKEDSNKTISSFQNVSYKGSSNENSVGSQPKITLNCYNVEQVENYFTNSNQETNFSASTNINFINDPNNNNLSILNKNQKTDSEKIKIEYVIVGGEHEEEKDRKEKPVIEHLELERVEIEKRMRKIKDKIEYEYQRKLELKQKAFEYITNFQNEKLRKRDANKLKNLEEEDLFRNQKLENNKVNPWRKVMQNINIKESDYKGSANIPRMRECIINRKADFDRKMND